MAPAELPELDDRKTADKNLRGSFWGLLIWFLLMWFLVSSIFGYFQEKSQVEIPYSSFKEEIRNNNIDSVTIAGSRIIGRFKRSYLPENISSPEATGPSQGTRYQMFSTVKPDVEDPELLQLLEEYDVVVNVEPEEQPWFFQLLIYLLPWILIIGFFVYTGRKAGEQMKNMGGGGAGGIFGIGQSRAKRYYRSITNITFKDVAGLENAKQDLTEIIEYLKNPKKFARLGATVPKGILLLGPPGCGKTLLARATAGEANIPFFSISGSEFVEMFVGVGASRVRDMFMNAKREAPSIIFIDEIDSIGRTRGSGYGGGHDEREQTLNQILSEMDGFEPQQSVVVMAATNRPDVLDPALTRPGRFDRHITIELPKKQARIHILQIHVRDVPLKEDVDLENLAARAVGFSGADLKNLVNEAALLAGRKNKEKVDSSDFEEARDKVLLGAEREELLDEREKNLIAFHEAGHALLAKLLPDADPLQKVTIIPRGAALGSTEQIPEIDRHNYSRSYLLDLITVRLGGRSAEGLVFGEVSNGAAADLKQVTQIARKMICQWGMSDRIGPISYQMLEDHVFLGQELSEQKDFSEYTARIIDEEIHRIISESEQRAMDVIKNNRGKLEIIAQALVRNETLSNDEIDKLLNSSDSHQTS
ncbi:MAG: ATP-dependent zinc metalloprotease FtsH [Candidatus Omnitrophota bacterium]